MDESRTGGSSMKRRFLVCVTALILGAGWALAATPTKPAPTVPSSAVATEDSGCAAKGCVAAAPCVAPECSDEADQIWVKGEYLLWHIKNGHLPPISTINTAPVFISPTVGTVPFSFQDTVIFPQGMRTDDAERSGGRLTAGIWLDDARDLGIETSYFQLERRSVEAIAQQITTLNLGTPFFAIFSSIAPGAGTPVQTTIPSTLSGTLTVDAHARASSTIWGTETNARTRICYLGNVAFDILAGARYLDLREDLAYRNTISLAPDGPLTVGTTIIQMPPVSFSTFDAIRARNQFYGAQIGTSFDWMCGRVSLFGQAKFALGDMHQSVNVFGLTTTPFGAFPGGVLVAPADIGRHSRDHYAFVPEVTTNLGYSFTQNLRGFVGYNFLFLQNVARPGNEIGVSEMHTKANFAGTMTDVTVRQPEFRFSDATVWMQGVNFGLELRY